MKCEVLDRSLRRRRHVHEALWWIDVPYRDPAGVLPNGNTPSLYRQRHDMLGISHCLVLGPQHREGPQERRPLVVQAQRVMGVSTHKHRI